MQSSPRAHIWTELSVDIGRQNFIETWPFLIHPKIQKKLWQGCPAAFVCNRGFPSQRPPFWRWGHNSTSQVFRHNNARTNPKFQPSLGKKGKQFFWLLPGVNKNAGPQSHHEPIPQLCVARMVHPWLEKQPRPCNTTKPELHVALIWERHNLHCSRTEVRGWNCLTFTSSPPEKQDLFLCLCVGFKVESLSQRQLYLT